MVQFRIGGNRFYLSVDQVRAALSGKDPERIYDYAVWVDGRWCSAEAGSSHANRGRRIAT